MLSQLNPSQREAVEYLDGPSLVIAGAGSGKTRVLTYKIAYLLTMPLTSPDGSTPYYVKPWEILALTFTNKAANEMKQRIGNLVGNDTARYLQMGTFHSVFSRILRAEAQSIRLTSGATGSFNSQFTIYDETDSRSLLKSVIKDMQLDDKVYKPATVHSRISMAKNNIELPDDYARNDHHRLRDRDQRMEKMPEIYATYQQRLQQSNAMDFDDLLLYTYLLFKDNEDVRQKYGERFKYVLVDEYQDTNAVQQMIVLQIVRDHHRVCVVGDDAQSIYGFRGANIDNILDFQTRFSSSDGAFPPVRLFKLEQNYRSTQCIVNAANSLIDHNQRQIRKKVFSDNAQGDKLKLKYCYSDREEATIVCKDIRRIMRSEGLSFSDFAILYRTNAQSRTFEEQMRKDMIPYRIYGGLSFYQRKEIKDVIAYFRLVVNHNDEEALRRVINYPARGIGNATVEKVIRRAQELGLSPWEVIADPEATQLPVNKGTMTKLLGFAQLIKGFAALNDGVAAGDELSLGMESDKLDAFELGKHIIQQAEISKDIYSGTEPEDISRQENLQELIDSMREFVDMHREESGDEHVSLSDFLQEVSLMSDLDNDDKKIASSGEADNDKVVLMTIHSAKGLEFPTVFIVGMEENIFPSPMCCDSQRAIEEERRLLYVAITRAEKHCILTSAQNRYRYGRMEFDTPSRFLSDIDTAFMDIQELGASEDGAEMPWTKQRRTMFGDFSGDVFGGTYGSRKDANAGQQSYGRRQDTRRETSRSPQSSRQQSNPFAATSPRSSEQSRQAETFSGRRLRRVSPGMPTTGASSSSSQNANLTAGARIEHDRFGIGTVLKVEGSGENAKATVEFQNSGTKQLLLKFARFKVL